MTRAILLVSNLRGVKKGQQNDTSFEPKGFAVGFGGCAPLARLLNVGHLSS
jgi:hypothetical protein